MEGEKSEIAEVGDDDEVWAGGMGERLPI